MSDNNLVELAQQLHMIAINNIFDPSKSAAAIADALRAQLPDGEAVADEPAFWLHEEESIVEPHRPNYGPMKGWTPLYTHPAPTSQASEREERLRVRGNELLDAIDEPPESNCSCHLAPPCGDCVDYGHLREAIRDFKAALSQPTELKPLNVRPVDERGRVIDLSQPGKGDSNA